MKNKILLSGVLLTLSVVFALSGISYGGRANGKIDNTVDLSGITASSVSVTITSPVSGAIVGGGHVTISASCYATNMIGWVEILVDGSRIRLFDMYGKYYTSFTATVNWDTTALTEGLHSIKVEAWDRSGRLGVDTNTVYVGEGVLSKVSGDNQQAPINTALPNPLVVKVATPAGVPMSGIAITFAIDSQPAGATGASLSVTETKTDATGLASTSLTLGDKAGTYTVRATGGGTSPASVTFTAEAVVGIDYIKVLAIPQNEQKATVIIGETQEFKAEGWGNGLDGISETADDIGPFSVSVNWSIGQVNIGELEPLSGKTTILTAVDKLPKDREKLVGQVVATYIREDGEELRGQAVVDVVEWDVSLAVRVIGSPHTKWEEVEEKIIEVGETAEFKAKGSLSWWWYSFEWEGVDSGTITAKKSFSTASKKYNVAGVYEVKATVTPRLFPWKHKTKVIKITVVEIAGPSEVLHYSPDYTAPNITLNFVGELSGATYQWSIVRGSDKISIVGDTDKKAVTIKGDKKSDAKDDVEVKIVYTWDKGSGEITHKLTVREPSSLGASVYTTTITGPPEWGYVTAIGYTVQDQFGDAIAQAGIWVDQTVTIISNPFGVDLEFGDAYTDANGQVVDIVSITTTNPEGLPTNFSLVADQIIDASGCRVAHNIVTCDSTHAIVTSAP